MGSHGNYLSGLFKTSKPYIAMISLQFGYAGMNVITKLSLNGGMSHYVLVVYRHAFAALSMAPFALILERKIRPKITWSVFMQIFVLGLLGPVIDQNFYYAGLNDTSPTFSCAMSNILPAMTFVLALICRMEKVEMRRVRCQAKVAGTLVTVAGAMLMTIYKGAVIISSGSGSGRSASLHQIGEAPMSSADPSDKDWVKGSIFVIIATLAWAALFIIQAFTLTRYPAPLSLTTLICFVGTLQSIVVTLCLEHAPSAWNIGFDMNLFTAAYSGIVASGVAYYVQGLVIQDKGPVFASAFSPLMMIIVAIMGSFVLSENIYLGGILGAILIVMGLYSVLWGKYKEGQEEKEELPVAVKGGELHGQCKEVQVVAQNHEKPSSLSTN